MLKFARSLDIIWECAKNWKRMLQVKWEKNILKVEKEQAKLFGFENMWKTVLAVHRVWENTLNVKKVSKSVQNDWKCTKAHLNILLCMRVRINEQMWWETQCRMIQDFLIRKWEI